MQYSSIVDDPNFYYKEAFKRNIGLITEKELNILRNSTVAIPGLGGVGGSHLICLSRIGVGNFKLSDFDVFEPVNINRQYGARVKDFGRKKLDVLVEEALNVNPHLNIKTYPEGISHENIDDFLDGVKVVVDGLDFFNIEMRQLLFNRALSKGCYVITAGPLGFSSALLVFDPKKSPNFDEYFDIKPGMTKEEKLISFAIGLAPGATQLAYMNLNKVDLSSEQGPSIASSCYLCTALAATETIRILLNRPGLRPVPCYAQFDPYTLVYKKGKIPMGNKNPIQRFKRWWVLKKLKKISALREAKLAKEKSLA